jgi:hypothetical protein
MNADLRVVNNNAFQSTLPTGEISLGPVRFVDVSTILLNSSKRATNAYLNKRNEFRGVKKNLNNFPIFIHPF